MKNGTKLQIINQMCKCFFKFLKKISSPANCKQGNIATGS